MIRTWADNPGVAVARRGWCALRDSDFVRKVAGTVATRFFLIGVGLTASILVARVLGPEQKGVYAAATTLAAIGVQFGNLGLHASNTYYVARDRASLPNVAANSLLISFVVGGVGALVLWFLFQGNPSLAPVHGASLSLALVYLPLSLANLLSQNILIGIHEIRAYNYIEIFSKLSFVIACGLLILLGQVSAEAVLFANICVCCITVALTWKRISIWFSEKLLVSFNLLIKSISYGFKAYLSALFAFLVLRVDLIIVQYLLGSEATGYYSIAASMGDIIFMLPTVIGTILFPRLCASTDGGERFSMARGATATVAALLLLPLGIAAFVARPAVQFLYGKEFLPAVEPFLYLVPGIYFLGVETVAAQYLASVGFPLSLVWIWFLASVLNFVANLVLIPRLGIAGASISSTVTYFLVFVAVLWLSVRHAGASGAAPACGMRAR